MTPKEIAAEVLTRAQRRLSHSLGRAFDRPDGSYISDAELRRALAGRTLAETAACVRQGERPHLTLGLADLARTVQTVKRLFPESVEESRREGEAILNHSITIFGRACDLGPQIDWHADPTTGARWPLDHFTRIPMKPAEGANVRALWELNRLHHFTALGRAYLLTGDERFTEEFLAQLAHWNQQNPPRFGVNWTVAMEAAIRAVNIIAALEMFRASPLLTDDAIALILKILIAHGRFIRANLEFSHRSPSNHYLSDLIGLFVIGTVLPDLRESRAWAEFSASRLLMEMERQVLPDGVSYENSTAYHRLVLEIFLTFFVLRHTPDIERLRAMFNFTLHYLKPDGNAPLIGDSDDGRLLKFIERPAVDHSYLVPIAAALFEDPNFKLSDHIDEEALWWFGQEGLVKYAALPARNSTPQSQAFPDAQIYIQRSGPFYAIIDCGDHGLNGRGSHAHSDALSVEVFAFDRTFLRDPGTYLYTASEEWRNRFRSTEYHNTVRVDSEEISLIRPGHLFALGPNVRPRVNRWETTPERDVLDAEHYAYHRLAEPVTHRRVVTFDKREGYWTIADHFTGAGRHKFEFFFNFDAGLAVTLGDDHRAIASDEHSALAIIPASVHDLEVKTTTRWVSLSYGTRIQSSGIIYILEREVPFQQVTLLVPYRLGEEGKIERVTG